MNKKNPNKEDKFETQEVVTENEDSETIGTSVTPKRSRGRPPKDKTEKIEQEQTEQPEENKKTKAKKVKLTSKEVKVEKLNSKKSRIKSKSISAIKLGRDLSAEKLNTIKKCKVKFHKMDKSRMSDSLLFFERNNKYKVLASLLVNAENTEQINFVKNVMLKRGFVNHLFNNLTWIENEK
jgi:hypothetical protein